MASRASSLAKAPIRLEGWSSPPPDEVLSGLAGAIVHVAVGGTVGRGRTPFGNFFRFARVVETKAVHHGAEGACARCKSGARWHIAVTWEAGYTSADGNILCERCIDGILTSGADDLVFPNG